MRGKTLDPLAAVTYYFIRGYNAAPPKDGYSSWFPRRGVRKCGRKTLLGKELRWQRLRGENAPAPLKPDKVNEVLSKYGVLLRSFLRAQYRNTQKQLEEAGIKKLRLCRGVIDKKIRWVMQFWLLLIL